MNEIFILRHGQAEEPNEVPEKSDFNRNLTKDGKTKTKNLSLFFNKLQEEVDLVLSSPYLRAKETAEILVSNIAPKPELKIVDFLSCGASSKEIAKGLIPYSTLKKVVLVGHAPDLELFLGKIIGGDRVKLKKGAIAKIVLSNPIELSGDLEWLITPKVIKKIK